MKSYSSQLADPAAVLREVLSLYRSRSGHVPQYVGTIIRNLRRLEEQVQSAFGVALRDLDVLDIGAGQLLTQMIYFSNHNRVVGIDWDLIVQGFNPLGYARMLFANGPRRTAKTIGRKLLGIDRRHRRELKQQLNLQSIPKLPVYRMDACAMTFPSASFDFVHSYSVFHHLPDPGRATDEVLRVLRPGGVAYIAFHLYSSETGSLDPRQFVDEQGALVRWPHLRPAYAGQTLSNAFLNRWRLGQWRELFDQKLPGAQWLFNRNVRPGAEREAEELIASGEAAGYSAEELLVHDVTVLWRKPGGGESVAPGAAMPG